MKRFSATRITVGIFSWSQVFIALIALLSALASAVRTFQTTSEIYAASGAAAGVVIIVAIAFTLAVEGAIFFLALAQERQHIQWRQAKKRRNVTTIKTVWRALMVRIGRVEPLTYDQMPESDMSLNIVIWIAFGFALVSNFYMGMKPLIEQLGSATVQSFISGLLNAPAHVQTDFIVDFASVIFPPGMALVAGKLTARFASKMVSSVNRSNATQEKPEKPQSERKPSKARKTAFERISEHLAEHPEDVKLSQRQLSEKVGVSVGSVNAFKARSTEQSLLSTGNLRTKELEYPHRNGQNGRHE